MDTIKPILMVSILFLPSCGRERSTPPPPQIDFNLVDSDGRTMTTLTSQKTSDLYLKASVASGQIDTSDLQIEVLDRKCANLSASSLTLSRSNASDPSFYLGKPVQISVDPTCTSGQFVELKIQTFINSAGIDSAPISFMSLRIQDSPEEDLIDLRWAETPGVMATLVALWDQTISPKLRIANTTSTPLKDLKLSIQSKGPLQKQLAQTVTITETIDSNHSQIISLDPMTVSGANAIQNATIAVTVTWQTREGIKGIKTLIIPIQQGFHIENVQIESIGDPAGRDTLPLRLGFYVHNDSRINLGASVLFLESIQGAVQLGYADRIKIQDLQPDQHLVTPSSTWELQPTVDSISEKIVLNLRWISAFGYTLPVTVELYQKERNVWAPILR